MDPTSLKAEFEKQIKDADTKILAAEKQLKMLQDYKMKIMGGLETLELLNPKTEVSEQVPAEVPAE
tara:strand:+ start:89 stop:286 length:198 start_codon:yes stop_codon:yes gene_type:complete